MKQREIKFRYRIGKNGELSFFKYLTIEQLEKGKEIQDTIKAGGEILGRDEYTGRKDKNGKEIYEGDIVWCKLTRSHQGGNYEVNFSNGCFYVYATRLYEAKEIEIIGNIYENKELLNETD